MKAIDDPRCEVLVLGIGNLLWADEGFGVVVISSYLPEIMALSDRVLVARQGKIVEEMANDLYQFPEMPVCNELNAKMREIYEDVEQAQESEDAPALEIAVQKEDALLDAIRNTKERIEDVEMWLPDIPDNIVWNMESFDADE